LKQPLIKSFWKSRNLFSKRFLAAGGKREYEWAVLLFSWYFITPIRDTSRAFVVSERSALKYSVRHKVLREVESRWGQVISGCPRMQNLSFLTKKS